MSAPPIATLVGVGDTETIRRARNWRRIGLVLIASAVVAGLSGLVGIRSATVAGTAQGYTLTVRHAQVTRAGLAAPLHVRVEHPGGFQEPIRVAVSEGFFERFDFQNFYPNPAKETASATWVYYDFDPPPGDVFEFHFDARTAPDQNGSTSVYRAALMLDDEPAIDLPFRLWVMP